MIAWIALWISGGTLGEINRMNHLLATCSLRPWYTRPEIFVSLLFVPSEQIDQAGDKDLVTPSTVQVMT